MFLLAAVVVASLAFGITKYVTAERTGALPPLEIAGDTAAAAPGALNVNKVFQARVETTVSINAMIGDEPMNGAGVVVSTDGTIVTASHVIKDYKIGQQATSIVVRFYRGDEVEAELVAIDQFADLAILKVDPAQVTGGVKAAPLAENSEQVLVGSEVLAIGAPFGYDWTASPGNVSAAGGRIIGSRINALSDIPGAIQFDASINTGNSGGPVFNARGEVIGISQQIASPNKGSVGVAFAVPSNLIKRAVRLAATGVHEIPYAELGLHNTRTVSPQLAKAAGLPVSQGTLGAMVQDATGPAAQIGMGAGAAINFQGQQVKVGDVIVELAGRKVTSSDDLERIAGLIDADEPVAISYLRDGQRVDATIDPTPRAIA
jgi:S1-C subfamily serine protease